MAHIVLIHGIGQEHEDRESLEDVWIPALAEGVAAADHQSLAEAIRSGASRGEAQVSVRMAAYGDLFVEEGAMGEDALGPASPEEAALAALIAREWLERAAFRGDPASKAAAVRELSFIDTPAEEMGPKEEVLRLLMNAVARVKWFAPTGMHMAQRVNRSLVQVTRYLSDLDLKRAIQQRVLDQVDDDTRVVIGHSLGSVVAYEVAARGELELPLLATLGSPLGLRTIVYDRVEPQPPVFPARTHMWLNVADRDDLVAAEPDLRDFFPLGVARDRTARGEWINETDVDNGSDPHRAEYYLRTAVVGRNIAAALHEGS